MRETLGWLRVFRPFILGAILLLAWPASDPRLVPPVGPIASYHEQVAVRFTRCGLGRGHACVIDGDTFKLGDRKIRIADINAPELASPQCPAEAQLAERSTHHLQALLNQAPFEMVANRFDRTDRYGRDLRTLYRTLPNGERQSIGESMTDAGLARTYWGALSREWC